MTFQHKRVTAIVFIVAILLLVPFIAMQFTNEVVWTAADFLMAAVLLLGTGLMIEMVLRKVKSTKYRLALCALVLLALFIIWAELAVGIFGSPIAGS